MSHKFVTVRKLLKTKETKETKETNKETKETEETNKETKVTEETKSTKGTKETKVDNDVIIYVGEEPDFKEFHANSKVLRSKSNHFKKILSDKDKDIEKKDGKYIIKEPNV